MKKIFEYLFPKKSGWVDVGLFEVRGYYKLIQGIMKKIIIAGNGRKGDKAGAKLAQKLKEGAMPGFNPSEIEDVRVIYTIKGRNYSINPKSEFNHNLCQLLRVNMGINLLDSHNIVWPSLEELAAKKLLEEM